MMMMRLAIMCSILAACGGGGGGGHPAPVPSTPLASTPPASTPPASASASAPAPGSAPVTPAPAAKATAEELEHVDVFGSKQLGREAVLARWGDQLARLLRDESGFELKERLEAEIKAAGSFAFVDISLITYFSPNRSYATVDLVDADDAARRMRFAPEPTATHPDPDGLLALYREYFEKVMKMLRDGAIKPAKEDCPFWHCISFGHESLIPYRDAFAKRVPPVEKELAGVLREDRNATHRADAAFLLAHISSGTRVVELMLPAIRDASPLVRNNAMRVLALISEHHPEIPIPVEPIIEALHFPATTDRNKAAAILGGISSRPMSARVRDQIITGAGDVLVDMLALKQPNNHDYAYKILKDLSGRDLGEHAASAWRAWLRAPR
jgi:hypothetical protein